MLADFVLLKCGFFIRPTISFKNNIDKVSTLRDSLGSNMPKLNTENSNLGRRINLIKSHFRNSRSIMWIHCHRIVKWQVPLIPHIYNDLIWLIIVNSDANKDIYVVANVKFLSVFGIISHILWLYFFVSNYISLAGKQI